MFLYTQQLPELSDKFLYHYTNSKALFEILKSMSLRVGSFKDLNDLNEADIFSSSSNVGQNSSDEVERFIKEYCGQIGFTKNYIVDDTCYPGCNRPRMWAQYADNNKGACIVINESTFLKKNKEVLEKASFWDICNMQYNRQIEDDNWVSNDDKLEFLKLNYSRLFFKKHRDWEHEDERRIYTINGPKYLSILDCIEFIALGKKFEKTDYFTLVDVISCKVNSCYNQLKPHDFVQAINSLGNISLQDNSFEIIEIVKSKKESISEYIDFLISKEYSL